MKLRKFIATTIREYLIEQKNIKTNINDNFWKMFSEDIEVKATIVANAPSDDKFWQLVKTKIFEAEYEKNYNDILKELEEKKSTIDRLVEEKKELFDDNYEIQQELKKKKEEVEELTDKLGKLYKRILKDQNTK